MSGLIKIMVMFLLMLTMRSLLKGCNVLEDFTKIPEERRKVNTEFAIFSQRSEGIFKDVDCLHDKDVDCLHDMAMMDAKNWWATYDSQVPMLQSLAFKLLGQPSSSSCCERNWSTYKFIHSCTRNRLSPNHAQDLVYIHNSLRLYSKRSEAYTKDRTKTWDVGGDEHDNLDDVGCLEMGKLGRILFLMMV